MSTGKMARIRREMAEEERLRRERLDREARIARLETELLEAKSEIERLRAALMATSRERKHAS